MADFVANFDLENNEIESDFNLEQTQFDAILEVNPAGANWGSITGNIENQTDLKEVLDSKADVSTVEELSNTVSENTSEISNISDVLDSFGDIVTYNASDFATKNQGELADTALQPNDNISELTNDVGYITDSALSGYATTTDLTNGLAEKQDTISDLSTIRSNAENGQSAYTTIQNYGDIVGYSASDFATSTQGSLADTALQPNDNITELNNNAGYITGIDSEDVTTALGYTPYDSANPNGFISGITSSDVTTALGYTPYNSSNPNDYQENVIESIEVNGTAQTVSEKTVNITVPTDTSDLTNNAGYITSASLPTVNNATVKFQKNGTDIETVTLNQATNTTVNFLIPTQASDINAVPTSRTVNNKALSANISLDSTDVGALSSSTTINDLTTTAQQNALNSGATSTNIGQIATNTSAISTINGKIPSEASASNQLADKNFVNSSIATNTANFIGTFTSVADLEAYSGTLTNNDYAFVETTDSAGNTLYDRYKYTTATTPASWQFEYELNNSSFTANQWASINSGATTTNIGQIATNTNDISNINTTIGGYGNIVTYNASDFMQKNGGSSTQTISLTSGTGTTALSAKSMSTSSYISLSGTGGWLGSYGVSSNKRAVFYNGTGYTLAYTSELPTKTSDLTNDSGYITGINSSDVITALGYTPYDSSNPNGYTTNTGTVTSVNNVSPVSGNVTLSIPSKISDLTDDTSTNPIDKADYATSAGSATSATTASKLGSTDVGSATKGIYLDDGTPTACTYSVAKDVPSNAVFTDTTYSVMTGASSGTAGASGLVPTPSAGDEGKYLKGDGTWGTVSSSSGANTDLSNLTATGESHFQAPLVSGTNIKTINNTSLLGSGDIDTVETFLAIQGTTQFSDILAANNTGKRIFCKYNYYLSDNVTINNVYLCLSEVVKSSSGGLTNITQSFIFSAIDNGTEYTTICDKDTGWSTVTIRAIETTSNKVTSISSSSTDTQYPSAKSVVELLKTIYPVGSVYLSTNSTCPLASLFGTWTLVSSGRALWTGTGSNGNTTIAAGLPNIKGALNSNNTTYASIGNVLSDWSTSGALSLTNASLKGINSSTASSSRPKSIMFNANSSSQIYSDSVTTVQPPAYVVNVWRRTA